MDKQPCVVKCTSIHADRFYPLYVRTQVRTYHGTANEGEGKCSFFYQEQILVLDLIRI